MRKVSTSELSCYEELDDPTAHRLVRVALTKDKYSIRCELTTTRLPKRSTRSEPEIPYRALSYCWGTVKYNSIILVDLISRTESLIHVTESLYGFLSAVLFKQDGGWFFIDALCINQQDVWERSRQVQMMGEIYKHAYRVTIWLGDQDTDIAEFLAKLARSQAKKSGWQGTLSTIGKEMSRRKAILDPSRDFVIQRGWDALKSHPYWTRLWIVPEITVARSVNLQLGQTIVEVDTLLALLTSLVKDDSTTKRLLIKCRSQWGTDSLLMNLHSNAKAKCAVPHDRIYALLPICHDGADYQVDYTIPLEELFLQLPWQELSNEARYIIMGGLGITSRSLLDHIWREKTEKYTLHSFVRTIEIYPENAKYCNQGASIYLPATLDEKSYAVGCACQWSLRTHFLLARKDVVPVPGRLWSAVGLLNCDGSLTRSLSPNNTCSWAESLEIMDATTLRIPSVVKSISTAFNITVSRLAFATLFNREMIMRGKEAP